MIVFPSLGSAAEDRLQPAKMTESELLAKTRQLTQEDFELAKIAVRQAGRGKVKEFAERAVERGDAADKQLTDLAAAQGVTQAEKISQPMQERLDAIAGLRGQGFDPDFRCGSSRCGRRVVGLPAFGRAVGRGTHRASLDRDGNSLQRPPAGDGAPLLTPMNWEELFSLLTELGDRLGEKIYVLPDSGSGHHRA